MVPNLWGTPSTSQRTPSGSSSTSTNPLNSMNSLNSLNSLSSLSSLPPMDDALNDQSLQFAAQLAQEHPELMTAVGAGARRDG